ncbi:MAG: DUF4493 domain-containing protein [Tannerellaceae bacterium]|nr:DUF4493 domain-containing protein [Tannerellaceae bacterium]
MTKSDEVNTDKVTLKVQRIDLENQPITEYPLTGLSFEKEFEAGKYKLTAIVGEDPQGAPTTTPYYTGNDEVTLTSGNTETADITCRLTTSLIQVDYTGIQTVYTGFEYKTDVSTQRNEVITFSKDDEGKSGYFIPATLSVLFSYKGTNNDNWREVSMNDITDLKPQYKYILQYTVEETTGETTGSAGVGITINENPETEEGTITIELPKLTQTLLEIKPDDIGEISATVYAEASINNGSIINIIFEYGEVVDGDVANWEQVQASPESDDKYVAELTGLQPAKSYRVRIKDDDSGSEKAFDTKPIDININPWAKFVMLSASFSKKFDITDLNFQYRKLGSEDSWNAISVDIDLDGNYQAVVKSMDENVEYEYQLVSNSANIQSEISIFKTEVTTKLPYGNFDNWYYQNTKTVLGRNISTAYCGINGESLYWDSGNQGANYGVLNIKDPTPVNPTSPEENIFINGKAVKLKSQLATGVFAAASIFTGNFQSVSLSPTGATLRFGQPYTARPTKLKGYYRYEPVNITHTGTGFDDYKDAQDICDIYSINNMG